MLSRHHQTPPPHRGLRRLQIQTHPGYALPASGLSSNHHEVVLAKQLSLIRRPDDVLRDERPTRFKEAQRTTVLVLRSSSGDLLFGFFNSLAVICFWFFMTSPMVGGVG